MNYAITIETELFEHREVKPHFINPCCFGEDFAMWLKRELQPLAQDGFTFSDSIQEDYGWGFRVNRGKDSFWIALSYVGEGPQEEPAEWVVSLGDARNPTKRLLRKLDPSAFATLSESITRAFESNSSIRVIA